MILNRLLPVISIQISMGCIFLCRNHHELCQNGSNTPLLRENRCALLSDFYYREADFVVFA